MRAIFASLVLAVGVLTLPADPVTAQQPPAPVVGVEITFGRQDPAIGDRLLLTLRVRHRSDVAVTATPQAPAAVEFGKAAVSTLPLPGNVVQTTVTWRVQPFVVGRVRLDPFAVAWVAQDGRTGEFQVQPPAFNVIPTRAPGDTALRPLPDPVGVPGGPPAWLRPALVTLAVLASLSVLVGAALLVARQVRAWAARRRGSIEAAPAVAPLSAESLARESLGGLAGIPLGGPAAFEMYYGTIAAVVRRYLSERIGFNAYALTTEELERRMTANGVDRWQARLVGGLLERCDAAVYAHRFPDPASADHDLTVAFEIVELSRPGAQRTGVLPGGASA